MGILNMVRKTDEYWVHIALRSLKYLPKSIQAERTWWLLACCCLSSPWGGSRVQIRNQCLSRGGKAKDRQWDDLLASTQNINSCLKGKIKMLILTSWGHLFHQSHLSCNKQWESKLSLFLLFTYSWNWETALGIWFTDLQNEVELVLLLFPHD